MNILSTILISAMQMFIAIGDNSGSISIDLTNYTGIKDNGYYQLIIKSPYGSCKPDTINWNSEKTITYPISSSMDNQLIFVDVYETNREGRQTKHLLSTVAANENTSIEIIATDNKGIILSGSESNRLISAFWKKGSSIESQKKLSTFMDKELKKNHNNLYGAYIHSLKCAHDIIHRNVSDEFLEASNGDYSYLLHGAYFLGELEGGETYALQRSIAIIFISDVMMAGTVPTELVSYFFNYMMPNKQTAMLDN